MRTKTLICLAGAFGAGALAREVKVPASDAAVPQQLGTVTAEFSKGKKTYMRARGTAHSLRRFTTDIDLLEDVKDGTYQLKIRVIPHGGRALKLDYAVTMRRR